jgi:hypothetical protein
MAKRPKRKAITLGLTKWELAALIEALRDHPEDLGSKKA